MLTSIEPKLHGQEQQSENNGKRLNDQMEKKKGFQRFPTLFILFLEKPIMNSY